LEFFTCVPYVIEYSFDRSIAAYYVDYTTTIYKDEGKRKKGNRRAKCPPYKPGFPPSPFAKSAYGG